MWAHEQCAEWAPNAHWSSSRRDGDGVGGAEEGEEGKEEGAAPVLANVASEAARGRKLKCAGAGCGTSGAVLGCSYKPCRRSYHLPCARLTPGARFDEEKFAMLCPVHAGETCLPCDQEQEQEEEEEEEEQEDEKTQAEKEEEEEEEIKVWKD